MNPTEDQTINTPQISSIKHGNPLKIIQQTPFWKTILVIFAILLLPGIGILLMWLWTKWAEKLKIIITVFYALVMFFSPLLIYSFLFRPFRFSGPSMSPSFQNGEYALFNVIDYSFSNPKRFDVVIFKSPKDPSVMFVKRIVGLPGDKVEISSEKIYINGKSLDETYLGSDVKTEGKTFLHEGTEITVPNDSYFVLGDNRQYSSDSREWGFVKKDELMGKYWFTYAK